MEIQTRGTHGNRHPGQGECEGHGQNQETVASRVQADGQEPINLLREERSESQKERGENHAVESEGE